MYESISKIFLHFNVLFFSLSGLDSNIPAVKRIPSKFVEEGHNIIRNLITHNNTHVEQPRLHRA